MIALIIAYIFNIIDYIFTLYWVNLYGTEVEANPFMRWAFENDVAWVIKIVLVGGIFTSLGYIIHTHNKYKWAGHFLATVYALIVLYHGILFLII